MSDGNDVPVVLASASPRRLELLRRLGVEPSVLPADVDESERPGETSAEHVTRLAAAKADVAARSVEGDTLIVAADTVVVVDGTVLGKPVDDADAVRMLRALSGRDHEVITGVQVRRGGATLGRVVTTLVTFRVIRDAEIAAYVASGEPADKAGAYALQGGAGAFATRIDGSDTNVIGLPLADVVELAAAVGVILLPSPPRTDR